MDFKVVVVVLVDLVEICGCNGVIKGKVVVCIGVGVYSFDVVWVGCKVLVSCGVCIGLVEILLLLMFGGEVEVGLKMMCKCISFGYDDVCCEIVV